MNRLIWCRGESAAEFLIRRKYTRGRGMPESLQLAINREQLAVSQGILGLLGKIESVMNQQQAQITKQDQVIFDLSLKVAGLMLTIEKLKK